VSDGRLSEPLLVFEYPDVKALAAAITRLERHADRPGTGAGAGAGTAAPTPPTATGADPGSAPSGDTTPGNPAATPAA
jgi:hypothetical protein